MSTSTLFQTVELPISTPTLFHTLELPSGTWTIELSTTSNATTRVTLPVTAEEDPRLTVPADPWWEKVNTQVMKGVC